MRITNKRGYDEKKVDKEITLLWNSLVRFFMQ